MSLPWTVNTLMKNWNAIESAGLSSFVVRYGVLRFAPPIAMIAVVTHLHTQSPWSEMVLPVVIVPAVVGGLWAVYTWHACKKQCAAAAPRS